jgi:hypothetical protein
LVLSRYGGLGTHRYGVGFSGDAPQSWLTLQFEIEMTPTASNVLFGYWSHDIGGFHNGPVRVFRHKFTLEDVIGSNARLKLLQACEQWHSSRVSTFLTSSHCKLCPNTEGTVFARGTTLLPLPP